jgi:hypothetical protein
MTGLLFRSTNGNIWKVINEKDNTAQILICAVIFIAVSEIIPRT